MARNRKGLPGFVIFLIVILVLVGIPVGLYYGLVHDSSHKEIEIDPNYQTSQLFNNTIANAFDGVKESKKLTLGISNYDLNNTLYLATKEVRENGYIDGVYVDAKGKNINFVIEGRIFKNIIATKLVIETELKEEKIGLADFFIFSIKNLKVGRISGIQNIALNALKGIVSESTINKALADAGLSMKMSLTSGEILYSKSDLVKDLDSVLTSGSATLPFNEIIKILVNNDLLKLSDKDGINFEIDLEPLTVNNERVESYELNLNDSSKHNGVSLDKINENLSKILTRNKALNPNKDNLYKFLFSGYDSLTSSEKDSIKNLDYQDMGVGFNYQTYKGFDIESKNIMSICENKVNQALTGATITQLKNPGGFNLMSLKESELSAYLSTSSIIGFNMIFDTEINNTVKTNYIVIDNMYCNIYDTHVEFVAGLNINGLETTLDISTELNTIDSKANLNLNQAYLAFDLKGLKLGSLDGSENLNNSILDLLGSQLDDKLTYKAADKQLILDLSQGIMSGVDATYLETIKESMLRFSSVGESKDADGAINLTSWYIG